MDSGGATLIPRRILAVVVVLACRRDAAACSTTGGSDADFSECVEAFTWSNPSSSEVYSGCLDFHRYPQHDYNDGICGYYPPIGDAAGAGCYFNIDAADEHDESSYKNSASGGTSFLGAYLEFRPSNSNVGGMIAAWTVPGIETPATLAIRVRYTAWRGGELRYKLVSEGETEVVVLPSTSQAWRWCYSEPMQLLVSVSGRIEIHVEGTSPGRMRVDGIDVSGESMAGASCPLNSRWCTTRSSQNWKWGVCDEECTAAPTAAPSASPSTEGPTTMSPTSVSPTTASPMTASPTTLSPLTASPSTSSPSTQSPTYAPDEDWWRCALEHEQCWCDGVVRYGFLGVYYFMEDVVGYVECSNAVFGDPVHGERKSCECFGFDSRTGAPSASPTLRPTTSKPSNSPTTWPSLRPTTWPSTWPTAVPTALPTRLVSSGPTASPASLVSARPTALPSRLESARPTAMPSRLESARPTALPSRLESARPTARPSARPTSQSTLAPVGNPVVVPSATHSPVAGATGAPGVTSTPSTEEIDNLRNGEDSPSSSGESSTGIIAFSAVAVVLLLVAAALLVVRLRRSAQRRKYEESVVSHATLGLKPLNSRSPDMRGNPMREKAEKEIQLAHEERKQLFTRLRDILASPYWRERFRAMLRQRFAEENLAFVEAVEQYERATKKRSSHTMLAQMAEEIIESFVREGADNQVNLPSQVQTALMSTSSGDSSKWNASSFQDAVMEARREIMTLLSTNYLSSFLREIENQPAWVSSLAPASRLNSTSSGGSKR